MVNQSEPLLSAALAGLGLILQPLELVRSSLASGALVEVLPKYPSPAPSLSVLYPRDRLMTPKMQSFLDFCTSQFNEQSLTLR